MAVSATKLMKIYVINNHPPKKSYYLCRNNRLMGEVPLNGMLLRRDAEGNEINIVI